MILVEARLERSLGRGGRRTHSELGGRTGLGSTVPSLEPPLEYWPPENRSGSGGDRDPEGRGRITEAASVTLLRDSSGRDRRRSETIAMAVARRRLPRAIIHDDVVVAGHVIDNRVALERLRVFVALADMDRWGSSRPIPRSQRKVTEKLRA